MFDTKQWASLRQGVFKRFPVLSSSADLQNQPERIMTGWLSAAGFFKAMNVSCQPASAPELRNFLSGDLENQVRDAPGRDLKVQ
jgi:hypothetical protein